MRLLIDENLSLDVADGLRDSEHDVVHVLNAGLQSEPDDVIMARAATEKRIVLTADTDFGTLVARSWCRAALRAHPAIIGSPHAR